MGDFAFHLFLLFLTPINSCVSTSAFSSLSLASLIYSPKRKGSAPKNSSSRWKKRRKGRENRLPFTRREKRVLKQETVHVTNLAFLSNSHYDIVADSSLSLRPSWTILESQLLLSLTCTSITILISQIEPCLMAFIFLISVQQKRWS